MLVVECIISTVLALFFSYAPEYWKKCTDVETKFFISKLFFILTVFEIAKLIICIIFLAIALAK